MTMQCDVIRQDADPNYGSILNPPPPYWAPESCGHQSCREDAENCPSGDGFHDWDCPVATCRFDTLRQTCELDEGHAGNHEFGVLSDPIRTAVPS